MGRPFGSKNSEDASRLRKACRKVTDKVVTAWIEALDAERTIVVGFGDNARTETVPDHDVRIKAASHLADRGYGRPSQEVTGNVTVTTDHGELYERISSVLAEAGRGDDEGSTGEPH